MLKFSSCIMMMFTELPLPERITAAADAGFPGVEIQRPYDQDLTELAKRLERSEVECTLLNTPYGDTDATKFGRASIPGEEAAFAEDLKLAMDTAKALRCKRIHVMSGTVPEDGDPAAHRQTLLSNLRAGAVAAAAQGLTLHIEPLNHTDNPGYFLIGQAMGHSIVEEAGMENVGVQFDLYHAQMSEGCIADKVERYLDNSAYVQFAGVPGRHEPSDCEMNYDFLFGMLENAGYDGWGGAEHRPRGETLAGLGWAKKYGIG